jgi:hypothetical protein
MLPDAQFRVRGLGRIRDENDTTTELEFFHAYVLVEHGYTQEFLTAVSERSRWSMFILCDEEEQVIHFSMTPRGVVTARSFINREQLSFIRDPTIRLQ